MTRNLYDPSHYLAVGMVMFAFGAVVYLVHVVVGYFFFKKLGTGRKLNYWISLMPSLFFVLMLEIFLSKTDIRHDVLAGLSFFVVLLNTLLVGHVFNNSDVNQYVKKHRIASIPFFVSLPLLGLCVQFLWLFLSIRRSKLLFRA